MCSQVIRGDEEARANALHLIENKLPYAARIRNFCEREALSEARGCRNLMKLLSCA